MNCIILGSGNLATQLAFALKDTIHIISQIYSPNITHAIELAKRVNCNYTSNLEDIFDSADAYIISVKDDAISKVAENLRLKNNNAVIIHTAGSVGIEALAGNANHYGVLYPMQTFSKNREVDFKRIPCFLEASDDYAMDVISKLAMSVSENIQKANSKTRCKIHLAAVFASNLVNHCYRLAEKVLNEDGIDFSILLPLIEETAHKVERLSPHDAQTGPMKRNDTSVMERQLQLIKNKRTQQIYQLMAQSIYEDSKL